MTVLLTLGAVIFSGFEVPESIRIGGEQSLVVHKLPGSGRTIDAMGADDADIPWSGRFRGGSAEARARQLDAYRKSGAPILLQWSTYRYRVVVRSFEANYQQPFEIPYSVACTVVTDESAPILSGIPALDELIGSDLGNALGLSDSLGVAQIASGVATVQQAITAAGTLQGASTSSLAGIVSNVASAQQAVGASITAAESSLASSTPIVAGGSPAAMSSSLSAQASGFGQIAQLYQISSTLTRMSKNLAA